MNILVIKQTSLGDVLHASGHIRVIKKQYPDSHLVVLTAASSEEIYRHNPWIDELVLIDRYGFKKYWYKRPIWALNEILRTLASIRKYKYDLAFDLQGLGKSVLFLYGARSRRKFVKGRWWGLDGYRNKQLHAIKELDNVLSVAGVSVEDTSMECTSGEAAKQTIDSLLLEVNPENKPILIASPFSRWDSKDWPLDNFVQVSDTVSDTYKVIFTGSSERKQEIDESLVNARPNTSISVAGDLSLLEFVELVDRAALMLTGDSFPMHVAGAKITPVIALFGPTDESKVGPVGEHDQVIRVPDCDICDRKKCPRYCLARLQVAEVVQAIQIFQQ